MIEQAMSVVKNWHRPANGPSKTLEEVLYAINPQGCPRPPTMERDAWLARYEQACSAAAGHCRTNMHKFNEEALGDVQQRKVLMLREGVRFRNEWFAKEQA